MKKCSEDCIRFNYSCANDKCRHWIDYEDEKNCSLISVHINGPMTLMQIAERLNISFVRVAQIEKKALKKLSKVI